MAPSGRALAGMGDMGVQWPPSLLLCPDTPQELLWETVTFPGEGLEKEVMECWPGGAEVFHHTANVWCQQGTVLKAHSIQCLLLSKPSSAARTACPEAVGHHSRASHPAEGSACQAGEAVHPLHHSPPLCCALTTSSCLLAGLQGCFGQGSIFPGILLQ